MESQVNSYKQAVARFGVLALLCLGLAGCQAGDAPEPTPEPEPEPELPVPTKERVDIPLTKAEESIVSGNNAFSFQLLKAVAAEEEKENIFLSPLSATLALGMLNNGAAGTTAEEIRTALGYAGIPDEDLNDFFQKLIEALREIDPQVTLESANSIWIRNDFPTLAPFRETNQTYYDAQVRNADFSDPATLAAINSWCADHTNGMIDRILNGISESSVMYLLNALYFKGAWTEPFEKEQTQQKVFYNEDGTLALNIPLMSGGGRLNYAQGDHFEIVELPYGNEAFSMVFLLPEEGLSLSSVIENLDAAAWSESLAKLSPSSVLLSLPRLKLAYEIQLKETLRSLGMQAMFDDQEANFTRLSSIPTYVSFVKQKTALALDEEGAEAAAVTIIGIEVASGHDISMVLNRPFLLFIKEKSTGAILFEGAVRKLE
ncbi:MAG: serpin family protein [Tannerellaceae bacterium]|jgi:serpin B|nr:serpin family protein [Tannerellaceae bacterium]